MANEVDAKAPETRKLDVTYSSFLIIASLFILSLNFVHKCEQTLNSQSDSNTRIPLTHSVRCDHKHDHISLTFQPPGTECVYLQTLFSMSPSSIRFTITNVVLEWQFLQGKLMRSSTRTSTQVQVVLCGHKFHSPSLAVSLVVPIFPVQLCVQLPSPNIILPYTALFPIFRKAALCLLLLHSCHCGLWLVANII